MLRRAGAAVVALAATLCVSMLVTGAAAGTAAKTTNFSEQHVAIQANGYVIPGTFTTPRAGGAQARYPAVLLLHGTASQKDEVGDMYLRLAQELAARGYASLRIDFAGSGDSTLPQTAFTYTEEVADTEVALTWLSHNANVAADALGLVGFSQGGRVAATVAGTDQRVKAVATWSTWVEDGSTAYLLFGPDAYAQAQRDGQVLVDLGFRTWTYSLAFFESIKNSHPRRRSKSSMPPGRTTRRSTSSREPTTSTTFSPTIRPKRKT